MADRFETRRERRSHLVAADNPRPGLDCVIMLSETIAGSSLPGPVSVSIRYVPDRHILPRAALGAYLAALRAPDWDGLEALGAEMIGDLDSELLPRWVQVRLELAGATAQKVIFEQCKPDWQDRLLLSRLALD